MINNPLDQYLRTPLNYDQIEELSIKVFQESRDDLVEDLILSLYPLINIVYYESAWAYDEEESFKDDLIQDCSLVLFQEFTTRQEKFKDVKIYYSYYKSIIRNTMLKYIHRYQANFKETEIELDKISCIDSKYSYSAVEAKINQGIILKDMVDIVRRICCKRVKHANLIDYYIDYRYVCGNKDMKTLKKRLQVSGVPYSDILNIIEFVDHINKFAKDFCYVHYRMEQREMDRLDQVMNRFEDSTYEVLAYKYGDSILPEFYAAFGPEVTKKFVSVFSGRTIEVPAYRDFTDDLLGGSLLSLVDCEEQLEELAENSELSLGTLKRIYDKAVEVREELDSLER